MDCSAAAASTPRFSRSFRIISSTRSKRTAGAVSRPKRRVGWPFVIWAILTGLVSVAPPDTPRLDEIRLDLVVLSVTTVFSCACAFLVGVLPGLRASGAGHETVVRSGRGSTRQHSLLRRSLLIGEVAVATVLLSGAALMVHTMLRAIARRSWFRSA